MKIIKQIEFEQNDFELMSAAYNGNVISTENLAEELKSIIVSVGKTSELVKKYKTARSSALDEIKKLPVEIRRRYFEDFIKEVTQPRVRYDCEGKNVIARKYDLLENNNTTHGTDKDGIAWGFGFKL